jgi:hypothetical protein
MTRGIVAVMALAAGLAGIPPALGQGQQKPTRVYEPSSRVRIGLDTCRKDEVEHGPNCVKKCQPDFRLDVTTRPATCYALRPEARYVPPKVEYSTPEKAVPKTGTGY